MCIIDNGETRVSEWIEIIFCLVKWKTWWDVECPQIVAVSLLYHFIGVGNSSALVHENRFMQIESYFISPADRMFSRLLGDVQNWKHSMFSHYWPYHVSFNENTSFIIFVPEFYQEHTLPNDTRCDRLWILYAWITSGVPTEVTA